MVSIIEVKMKTCNTCGETLPVAQFGRDSSKRDGLRTQCKSCRAVSKREYYERNKERQQQWHAAWLESNRERRRKHARDYIKRNAATVLARTRQYQAAKLSATPAWSNKAVVNFLYVTRAYLTDVTGERWCVDHSVPLRHPLVCGLHVDANLRLVPETYNLKKNNRFPFND